MAANNFLRTTPSLNFKSIKDTELRQNFENLNDHFHDNNQLEGFKFFDLTFDKKESEKKIPHGMKMPPLDILVTGKFGDGDASFDYEKFDTTNMVLNVTGKCRIRFFAGVYWNSKNAKFESLKDLKSINGGSGSGSGNKSSNSSTSSTSVSLSEGAINLTQAGGVLSLNLSQPLILVKNGVTYTVSSGLTCAAKSFSANTLHYVYIVNLTTTPQLQVSLNVNSQGPSGVDNYFLVGAYLTNFNSSFGSFVNIEGTPISDYVDGGPVNIMGVSGNPHKPTAPGAIEIDTFQYRMFGSYFDGVARYGHNSATGATTGTGGYTISLPTNLFINTSLTPLSSVDTPSSANARVGFMASNATGAANPNGANSIFTPIPISNTAFKMAFANTLDLGGFVETIWSSTRYPLNSAFVHVAIPIFTAIAGWSNVPLKNR